MYPLISSSSVSIIFSKSKYLYPIPTAPFSQALKMQFSTITAAITLFAALAHASPTPLAARQFQAQLTFYGAADAKFFLSVPTDGSVFTISKYCAKSCARLLPSIISCVVAARRSCLGIVVLMQTAANPLSISYINSEGGASCSFTGIDGSHTTVVGAQTVVVGPPQTQISGSCLAL